MYRKSKHILIYVYEYIYFSFPENPAVYEIKWEDIGRSGQATDDNIIRRIHFACWVNKATNTHSEYVILIASPRQRWLRERATILRYMYIACLVIRHYKSSEFVVKLLNSSSKTNICRYSMLLGQLVLLTLEMCAE